MDDVSRMVARQYEAYAYPEPFPDLAAKVAAGYFELGDPSRYGPLIWPEGRPRKRLRILSAGCGTVQAAYLAFTNRDCEVVGVDLSAASLGHERYLQDRHALSNLHLYQGDLRDAGRLGQTFDYIVCSGVLHHLADPDAGLRALTGVLAPDGAILLMVYGATARAGVYMVQDALRRLRVPQTTEGVTFARHLLEQLPDHHYVRWYLSGAAELKHDAALVDTFLHPQDRAYTVPQLLEFLARNGLALQGWIDNGNYFPDAALAGFEPEIRDAVAALPESDQWAVSRDADAMGRNARLRGPAGAGVIAWPRAGLRCRGLGPPGPSLDTGTGTASGAGPRLAGPVSTRSEHHGSRCDRSGATGRRGWHAYAARAARDAATRPDSTRRAHTARASVLRAAVANGSPHVQSPRPDSSNRRRLTRGPWRSRPESPLGSSVARRRPCPGRTFGSRNGLKKAAVAIECLDPNRRRYRAAILSIGRDRIRLPVDAARAKSHPPARWPRANAPAIERAL